MTNRFSKLAVLGVLALSAAGCNCRPPGVNPVDQCNGVNGVQTDRLSPCEQNNECADHYACLAVKDQTYKCCQFQASRPCNTEADCCAGQTCPDNRKTCQDKFLECEDDAACGDTGDLFCTEYVDLTGRSSKRCRPKACGASGECQEGTSCFQGECLAALPCDGACEPGKACVPSINRCQDYTNPTGRPEAACPMSCGAGFISTFADNRNLWDTCSLPNTLCKCAELPGLRSTDLGRHSAIALEAGKGTLVSAYDGQYGDLVVYTFDTTGKQTKIEYVDGVPEGTPKFGPSGARKGITEVGDDVGRYTDIAVGTGGQVYVSYYDVTKGDLRFATRNGSGAWSTIKVDGDNADLGLFTSVAIDEEGVPGISYFQKGGSANFDASTCPGTAPTGPKQYITALKFAKATSANPGASDWTIKTVACMSRPAPACTGCANVCADDGTGPGCYMPAPSCTQPDGGGTCDPNTDTCVMIGTKATCAKKYNPSTLNDIPQGVGLFTSLGFNGKEAYIAYMRRQTPAMATVPDGDLMGVVVSAAGTVQTPVVLDGNGDTGFFPDVKFDPSSKAVAVGYHDFSSKAFKFYTAPTFRTGVTAEIIDPGTGAQGSGENSWVGTDSALVYGGGGLYAVYQDPTKGDLKLAKKGQTWQVQPSIATQGAVGFFADAVFNEGKLYCSHARIHARLVAGEPHVDNALILESVAAP